MATPTTYLRVEKQANNENVGTWDQNLGVAFDLFDLAIAGTADISTTGGETTLADTQYVADDSKAAFLDISGTLASDATIVVPARDKIYGVRNATSGSYTVTIKTSTGTGVVIPQSSAAFIRVDSSDDDVDFVTAPTAGTSGVLPITQGGTGATTASAARSALGLEIGTNVQAQSAALNDIDGLTPTDGNIIVGDGANWVAESGATARTSLGLGTGDSPTFTAVTVGATGLTVGSSVPFSDSSGTLTLQNIDALDATTEATIEAAIDTLANLTSIQGRTVTLADAGANAVFGWDDTAGAYENLTAAEATAILDAFVGDSGSGGTKGLVPAPTTGDATKFLKGDGTWTAVPGGGDALTTNPLSQFAATTSAELAGVISDETGSGALVFANTPSLVTPDIGAATGDSLTLDTGGALRTSTTDTNTLLLQAYDVDGAAYTTFATLTAGNTPTMDLSASVTVGSQPILVDSDIGSTVQAYDADLTTWAGITPGTGVGAALAVNVGTAGAFVVNGGALGTPSSATLTNATGLPISTGVSGLGTGVATFLATPSSANLASAITDETGSGALVFGTSPTLAGPTLTGTVALSSGGVLSWNSGDVTATHSANTLTFAGASSGYVFNDGNVGIGGTPTVKLHCFGDVGITDVSPQIDFYDTTDSSAARILHDFAAFIFAVDTGNITANSNFRWQIDGSEVGRWTTTGFGIGTTSPSAGLDISQDSAGFRVTSTAPGMTFRRAGTSVSSPVAVSAGQNLGSLPNYGYDGTTYTLSSNILFQVDGAVSSGVVPGRILFYTANASGTNTERMRIDSSGNVGIGGAATSGFHLHVASAVAKIRLNASSTDGGLYAYNDGSSALVYSLTRQTIGGGTNGGAYLTANSWLGFAAGQATVTPGNAQMVINSSGNVGIGTTSPDCLAHLFVSDATAPAVTTGTILRLERNGQAELDIIGGATSFCILNFGDSGDTDAGRIAYDHASNNMYLRTNSTDRLTIDSSGNVGIGTTSPSTSLVVVGQNTIDGKANTTALFRVSDTTTVDAALGVGSTNGNRPFIAALDGTTSAASLDFYTGADLRMRIDASTGNVGIGTTSPSGMLHVDQSSTTAAVPVLYLDQADVSEEMIQFETTIGTGNAIEAVGAKTLTTTHFIKVTIPGGLTRYIPVGTIA